jgi:uncharacterized phage protein gp47/JayE
MATNPAFDYASRNFANIKQDLLTRASVVAPEWTDRDPADFGMVFVDLWSYMGDILHYYIDRASKEAFIQSATQKESVLAYANLYDYTPNFKANSQTTVYVANSGSASVSIPQYTQFVGQYNDEYFYFYSTSEVTAASATTVEVTVREGTRVVDEVLTSNSNGQTGQRYKVRTKDVAPSTIEVFVTEEGTTTKWIRYTSLSSIPLGVGGYILYTTSNGETEVVFGNRSNGRIPPAGCNIKINYATGSGSLGNLPQNAIYGFTSLPNANLSVSGSAVATGGSDGESVESIRRSLQAVIRAQDRAVTLQDFKDLTLGVNGVFKAVASYTSGAGGASVNIYALPLVTDYLTLAGTSIAVSSDLRTTISDTVTPKTVLGTTVSVASSITVNRVNISLTVQVNDKYVASWVKSDVEDALDDLFVFGSVDFGQEVRLGDIYKLVMSIEGVDYCTVSTFEMRDPSNSVITTGNLSPVQLLKKGTITVTTAGGMTVSA